MPTSPSSTPPLSDRARAALDQGILALSANLLDTASQHLALVMRTAPHHPEARLLGARLRLRRQHPNLALRAITDSNTLHSDDRDALTEALERCRHDRADLALTAMGTLSKNATDRPEIRRALVAMLLRTQKANDAVMILDTLRRTIDDVVIDRTFDFITRSISQNHCAANATSSPTLSPPLNTETITMGNNKQAIGFLHTGRRREAGRAFFRAARLIANNHPNDTHTAAAAWAGVALCAQLEGRDNLRQRADAKLASLTDRAGRRRMIAELYPHTITAPLVKFTDIALNESPLQVMLSQAAQQLATTATQHPGRADAHYHRAVCDAARGEAADACSNLEVALTINPNYEAAGAMARRLGIHFSEEESLLADPYGL